MLVIPAHIFREYDIRGVAESDLQSPLIEQLGQGLAQLMANAGRPPRIVVLRDCRTSGPRLRDALVAGLVKGGCQVMDIGVGPTPLMYFAVHHLTADGGVMITGSHNPPAENGFKLMKGVGPFFGQQIQELRALIESGSLKAAATPGSLKEMNLDDAYLAKLKSAVTIANPTIAFAVDAGNGAAGPLGLRVLRELGCNPAALYCEMDGNFPNHHPDPTVPENLSALVAEVKRSGALMGLAWDGDGDRLGVVDKSGELIWGDRLLALFARRVLRTNPGATVIGDVKCSQSLFDDVNAHGGTGLMWKTGHSLIKQKMKEQHALLAGEMSGHFFFADRYFGYDDGIYAALRMLEIVAETGKSPAELLLDLPKGHSTPEIRVPCPDALKFQVVDAVKQHFRGKVTLSEIDGVRMNYDDGSWGLVRASNTGPLLVLRCEAGSEQRLTALRQEVEAAVSSAKQQLGAM
ncbi:MAG TPA: phosphomannomutase/phosphoglucomutase [Polyangiaceae bacterium]|nr:phosphomannomutase/phosphoglucomutase [Polyangiaceae bacterium]